VKPERRAELRARILLALRVGPLSLRGLEDFIAARRLTLSTLVRELEADGLVVAVIGRRGPEWAVAPVVPEAEPVVPAVSADAHTSTVEKPMLDPSITLALHFLGFPEEECAAVTALADQGRLDATHDVWAPYVDASTRLGLQHEARISYGAPIPIAVNIAALIERSEDN
jgi:DNA-binding HxlR family transcriptional regulator